MLPIQTAQGVHHACAAVPLDVMLQRAARDVSHTSTRMRVHPSHDLLHQDGRVPVQALIG